ncbi:MAG: AAA family ATPase [Nitriliruptorales bacterium]|nr:AAA family ATPase [Nitriliruptorales bacterium]
MSVRHLHRIEWHPSRGEVDRGRWPFDIPAVGQLIDDGGWDVPAGVTFLVGENGSGKSTLVEAFAAVYPRRGVENPFAPSAGARPQEEDSPLRWNLRAVTDPMASPAGFFLRSETLRQHLVAADRSPSAGRVYGEGKLVARSHGEAVLTLLRTHFTEPGVYFLDEPEAALSFTSTLGLVAVLDDLAQAGCQVIAATHSPLLTALPSASLLEVGEWGMRETSWEELELVSSWRCYLTDPQSYLRHLLPQRG